MASDSGRQPLEQFWKATEALFVNTNNNTRGRLSGIGEESLMKAQLATQMLWVGNHLEVWEVELGEGRDLNNVQCHNGHTPY